MNAGISVIKSQSNVLGRGLTDLEQRRRENLLPGQLVHSYT